MFWIVILAIAAVVAYRFFNRGEQAGAQTEAAPSALGSIWNLADFGAPVGRYGDGNVFANSGGAGFPVGLYGDGQIWVGSGRVGAPVGCYGDGQIWEGSGRLGLPIARYGNGNVWEGSGVAGPPVARYEGDSDGAAAAAFVLGIVKRPAGLGMPVG